MDVRFRTNDLQRCYERHREAIRTWGDKIGRRYIQRVEELKAARSAADLRRIQSLRFHALKGNREGQYAINLDTAWRLTLTFEDKALTIVMVEEVTDHYGD